MVDAAAGGFHLAPESRLGLVGLALAHWNDLAALGDRLIVLERGEARLGEDLPPAHLVHVRRREEGRQEEAQSRDQPEETDEHEQEVDRRLAEGAQDLGGHAVAAAADAVWEYARLRPDLDPVRFAAARRLDDLAYGAGVWWGAWRARSAAALLPVIAGPAQRAGIRKGRKG
jgi:hypothetical protein